jgi:hypothetical protein
MGLAWLTVHRARGWSRSVIWLVNRDKIVVVKRLWWYYHKLCTVWWSRYGFCQIGQLRWVRTSGGSNKARVELIMLLGVLHYAPMGRSIHKLHAYLMQLSTTSRLRLSLSISSSPIEHMFIMSNNDRHIENAFKIYY